MAIPRNRHSPPGQSVVRSHQLSPPAPRNCIVLGCSRSQERSRLRRSASPTLDTEITAPAMLHLRGAGDWKGSRYCGVGGGPVAGSPAGTPAATALLVLENENPPPWLTGGIHETSLSTGQALFCFWQWHERTAELVGRRRPLTRAWDPEKRAARRLVNAPGLTLRCIPVRWGPVSRSTFRWLRFARGAESLLASLPLGLSFWSRRSGWFPRWGLPGLSRDRGTTQDRVAPGGRRQGFSKCVWHNRLLR